MPENKPSCKDVMEHICDNLGEQLDSPRCLEIKHHMDTCPNCTHYFSNIDATIKFYKNYNVTLSEEAHLRLLDFLKLRE